ncbi:YDG domain-containing protein, partial [Oscillospiraceae bacterium 38-13]
MKRRILSIITALALCLSLCPTWVLAAEADPALCPHHREHTEECGYIAPSEGQPCGHEHTAECYALEVLPDTESGDDYEIGADTENLLDCQHTHDSECGYAQADPGQSCGYECRICPIEDLIAALPDKVTEDNAEDVRAQLDKILALFAELTEDEQEQIDLSRCYELQEALDGANDPAPITESVEYQEASWDGSQVTYESKTETCTLVENSAEAVTWTTGWYAVSGTVTISEPITVSGEVNLILVDGCTLTAEKGIVVTTGNSLTIYAQSGGTGTLNATGTTDSSNNASAGIGGSTTIFDSGSITIHGGVINATGGASRWYSGAGIGGSTPSSGNGGNSGTIKIYGGTITAESRGFSVGAGIGGGGSGGTGNGGAGTNISIYGGNITAMSYSDNNGGAGIGGGSGQTNGGTGNITIGGGTIHSTGGSLGAGIGGGSGGTQSGNGTVTISGGKVTAVGGNYAAGIGGGGGTKSQYLTWIGGIGSVTITGGIVDAKGNGSGEYAGAPIGNGGNTTATATVNKTTGIVFENGAGTVCGDVTLDGSYTVPADYTLNIPAGASLSGSGTLSGGSAFTTENLTEDMISVPTNLYYDGKDRTEYLTTELSGELDKGITICGQTFTVSGWTLAVAKTDDLTYTATYTNNNDNTNTFTKTITLQKSGTDLTSEGKVQTYKGDTLTKDFTASDTITVKATPTATGQAPAKAAARLRGDPTAGQMVVFVGDTQVCAPADVGADGSYTMNVSAADVLAAAGGPGTGITLTAKFVGNDNMADGAGTATVNITAVARVEKDGITSYVDKNGLLNAFDIDNGNNGAVITLLEDVELTGNSCISIQIDCTLDFGGHTILADATAVSYAVLVPEGKTVTIRGAGGISGINNSQALQIGGNVTLEGGTFSCAAGSCVSVVSNSASLSVTSPNVRIENTAGRGLRVGLAQSVQLSAGTYSGTTEAITFGTNCSLTLTDLLADGHAYHSGNTPIPLQPDGKELTGTVTVKACTHTGEGVCTYTHNENTSTHTKTCLACGYAGAAESCAYSDDYGHDETNHWQTCTLCGGKKTEAHGWVHQCTSATGIIRRSCDKCEIETVVGTVSITPDFSVTYGKTGSATLVCTAELADGYSLEPADSADNCWVLMALSDGKSWNLGRELEVKLPADLPAGEYWYNASPRLSYQGNNTIVKRFNVIGKVTVTPAPLTVTGAAAKDRTYDGTNSVQITGVTLDGVLNSDNVSVDLTGLTGTLSGSDAETYTSVTLPRLTLTGGAASNYTLPQSMGAVPASVTISKATLTATGATVASKTYDGNTAASVSSVTFTGLVPGEALALGTDYTATGTFADANAGTGKSVSIAVTLKDSAKANNYNLTNDSVNATGTIAKASQTAPSITGLPTGTITYGDTFTLHTEGGVSWSASGAATVDSSGKVTVTGTGKVTITATKPGDNNHYSAEDQITFTAVPKVLTVTGLTAEDRAYDGTNAVEITDVALSGVVTGDAVSVNLANLTGTLNGSDVGTYTAVTLPRLTLTGGAASNYTLTQPAGAITSSVTIRKAPALTPKTGDLAVANKQAHTYTYGLGALRPDVPEGISLGSTAVTYELGTV